MERGECRYCAQDRECWSACFELRKRKDKENELTKEEKERLKNYRWANTMQPLEDL